MIRVHAKVLNPAGAGDNLDRTHENNHREFIFVVEKRGGKLIFSVNNMEICDVKTELESPVWGFIALNDKGSSLIKVDEVTIEQNLENE
jgi:hypothetical protein